jgi:type VI secretion system protein VasD
VIHRRALLALPATLALPLALPGCASPPPPPATLELTLSGGADQNPDPAGKPASAAVRIFQLTSTAKFERADVFALIQREAATLGTDDLGSEEFVIAPGEKRLVSHELKNGTQFVGVIVLFRDIDHARWRVMSPAPATGPLKLLLTTAGIIATLVPG